MSRVLNRRASGSSALRFQAAGTGRKVLPGTGLMPRFPAGLNFCVRLRARM